MANHATRALGAALVAALSVVPSSAQETAAETLTARGAYVPFFVSLAAATNRDGSVRWEILGPWGDSIQRKIASRATRIVQSPEGPCEEITVTSIHVSGDTRSLSAMIDTARAVYRAQIDSVEEGFYQGSPTTLIAAVIKNAPRVEDGFPTSGIVYVSYPKADFHLDGQRFCNAGPYTPIAGDNVVIFAFDEPRDQTGRFLLTRPVQVVFEQGGRLYWAGRTTDPLFASVSTLLQLEDLVGPIAHHPPAQIPR